MPLGSLGAFRNPVGAFRLPGDSALAPWVNNYEWLMKAWGHLPIPFFEILGTFKMFTNYGPLDPDKLTT